MRVSKEDFENYGFGDESVWEGSRREEHSWGREPKTCHECGEDINRGQKVRFRQGLYHSRCARDLVASEKEMDAD